MIASLHRAGCVALVLFALPAAGKADGFDTEHLFGFTIGTDVGNVGEREIEGSTTARLAKQTGSYHAVSQTLSAEFVPVENFRTEFGAALAAHDIAGVSGLEDRRQVAFGGFSADLRYRFLDRATAAFGLAVGAEPHWGRIDDISGERVNQYGVDFVVAMDKEIVTNRVVAAFNLIYQPAVMRSKFAGTWTQESTSGVATAIMLKLPSEIYLGVEGRYLRQYDGLGFDAFAGQAFFLGPTLYMQLSERAWVATAWSAQVAGRSVAQPGSLDLVNFERHQLRFLFGISF